MQLGPDKLTARREGADHAVFLPETVRELRALYRAAEARATRLRLLAETGRDLTGAQDLDAALATTLDRAVAFAGHSSGLIETEHPPRRIARGESPREPAGALVLPLVAADAARVGRLALWSATSRPAPERDDEEALRLLAAQIAAAVATAARNAERERLLVALGEREAELERLVGRLLALHEEERRRVSHEVHDGIAQVAAGVHRHLEAFAARHRPELKSLAGDLDAIVELARRAVREARRVMAGLRPTVLDDFGLVEAIRLDLDHLREAGWTVRLRDGLGRARLATTVETTLYRVTQEALANARKHARADAVAVSVERRAGAVLLEIRDEGAGFDPARAAADPARGERIGLMVMRERVAWLGGTLTVESAPGQGTLVAATVPLQDGR